MEEGGDAKQICDNVEKMNKLFEHGVAPFVSRVVQVLTVSTVKAPADATVDSELLVRASMESAKMARAMRSSSGAFDVDEFVSRLITFMGGRSAAGNLGDDGDEYDDDEGDGVPLIWERIGWKAVAKSHRVPAMDFMCVVAYHIATQRLTFMFSGWDPCLLSKKRVLPSSARS